jgi:hypothetical protein
VLKTLLLAFAAMIVLMAPSAATAIEVGCGPTASSQTNELVLVSDGCATKIATDAMMADSCLATQFLKDDSPMTRAWMVGASSPSLHRSEVTITVANDLAMFFDAPPTALEGGHIIGPMQDCDNSSLATVLRQRPEVVYLGD